MASQGAVKRAGKQPETTQLPRAERAKKERVFDYTAWNVAIREPADFARYLAGYPDKSGLMAYVFRLVPRINFELIGIKETNILETATFSEMTPEHIAERFGRGKYMLILNDANRQKGQKEVCRTWFKLEDHPKPPVYDLRTLVIGHPDNMDEVNRQLALGNMVREPSGTPRLRYAGDPPPGSPEAAQNHAAAAPAASAPLIANDLLAQMLLGMMNRNSASPHETVKDTIEIAKLLHPPAPAMDIEQIVERVVTRLGIRPAGLPEGDMFTIYERMNSFVAKVSGGTPVAEGPAASNSNAASWVPHVPGIIREARAFIPDLFRELRSMRTESNGAPKQNGAPTQMTLEQRIEEIAALGFQQMEQGVAGFDFAAYVWNFHAGGKEVYRFLEPGGAVGLMALISMNPGSRHLVSDPQHRAQIEAFLVDFFSFDPDGGEALPEVTTASTTNHAAQH